MTKLKPSTSVIFIIGLIAAAAPAAHGEPVDCSQLMKNIKELAAGVSSDADVYWKRRTQYVELKFGRKHTLADAEARAAEEETLAAPLREGVAGKWAKLKADLAEADTGNCAATNELSSIREAAFARMKPVRIDQFPKEE
jgi:hypothetical protein